MIYSKIYEFCKVRNIGGAHKNGQAPSPRINFLTELLKSEGINYELDEFQDKRFPNNNFYNIILTGTSNKMVVAHHDIVNPNIDNANDNSCSVINAISIKKLRPDIIVVLLDGEEPPMMGVGSNHLGQQIKDGKFDQIEFVLNLELTGKGGKNFFVGNYPGPLTDKIKALFNCPVVHTPFNDVVILRRFGIDSTVINPLPELPEGEKSDILTAEGKYLDFSMLFNCHSSRDTLDTIDPNDMKEFVEQIVLKILE